MKKFYKLICFFILAAYLALYTFIAAGCSGEASPPPDKDTSSVISPSEDTASPSPEAILPCASPISKQENTSSQKNITSDEENNPNPPSGTPDAKNSSDIKKHTVTPTPSNVKPESTSNGKTPAVSPEGTMTEPEEYWPTKEWKACTPEEQGMDSETLYSLVKEIKEKNAPIDSLLIARNGYIVTEMYFNNNTKSSTHLIQSCTKSITSILVGIAIKEKHISSTDLKVLDVFSDTKADRVDTFKSSMTLKHLLTMTSGIDWDEWQTSYGSGNNPASQLMSSSNTVKFVLDRPMATEPGKEFKYNSGASHLLSAAVAKSTGIGTQAYAQEKLFGPLGIPKRSWWSSNDRINYGGYGLSLTARDMAKIGLLYLNEGKWEDKQIVPESWVEESTRQYVSLNLFDRKDALGKEEGYGFQWWINSFGGYSARGLGGQYIFVLPQQNLVVVFQGHYGRNDFPPVLYTKDNILPAVKSVHPLPPNPKFSDMLK